MLYIDKTGQAGNLHSTYKFQIFIRIFFGVDRSPPASFIPILNVLKVQLGSQIITKKKSQILKKIKNKHKLLFSLIHRVLQVFIQRIRSCYIVVTKINFYS